jgi:magnesium-transporting ATPase (P-type)
MSSKFGLFRFLSIINLVVAGFIVLMLLLSLMFMPAMSLVLISMLVTGAVVIHSLLSLGLQQSIKKPARPLKENTPGGLRIMGFIAIFYAVLLITNGIYGLIHLDEVMKVDASLRQTMPQLPNGQAAPAAQATRGLTAGILVVMVVHAVAVLVNCALSFSFLRQWQEAHREHKE